MTMKHHTLRNKQQSLSTVFVLEDNKFDQQVIERGVKKADPDIEVNVVDQVGEAITWLAMCDVEIDDSGDSSSRPDLIFVDLTLPGIYDGDVLLKEAQKDPIYKHVPQIIISGSKEQANIKECYRNGAVSYIVKPDRPEEFEDVIASTIQYWNHVIYL